MSALELDDVVVEYERRGLDPVRAVAGASVEVEPRPDRRPRRRVRLRQVDARPGSRRHGRAASPGRSASRVGTSRRSTRRPRRRELARLQMVFQNPFSSLNPRRRVGEQIGEALAVLGRRPRAQRAARVARSCSSRSAFRRPPRAGYPHEFSGGQRQRIAIARALAAEPVRDRRSTSRWPRSTPRRRRRSRTCSSRSPASSSSACSSSRTTSRSSATSPTPSRSCTSAAIVETAPTQRALGDAAPPLHRGADRAPCRTPTGRARCPRRCPARCRTPRDPRPAAASTRAARTRFEPLSTRRTRRSSSSRRAGRPPAGCSGRANRPRLRRQGSARLAPRAE